MSNQGCGCGNKSKPDASNPMSADHQRGGCGCGGGGRRASGGCGCGGKHEGREGQPVDEAGRMNLGLRASR